MTWFDSDYNYKKKITIDHAKVGGDETDFPVLISVTDADLADTSNGGQVESANGYDIIFTNSAENAQLKHEIERYVNTSGLLVYWVKVSSLSSTVDTDIYIYYGKAGVGADPSSTDTWDSNFVAVYHLNESAGDAIDSTANGNDGTYQGNLPTQIAGKNGYGQDFSRNTDYITLPAGCYLGTGGTVECWFEADATDTNYRLYTQASDTVWEFEFFAMGFYGAVDKLYSNGHTIGTDEWVIYPDWELDTNWHYYALSMATNDVDFFQDTDTVGTDESCDMPAGGYDFIAIGDSEAGTYKADGTMDEVRVSSTKRTGNWLGTTYETQNDPAGFMGWGGEEIVPLAPFTPSDTINISDSIVFKHFITLTDNITISDNAVFVLTFIAALADSVNVSDIVAFKHSVAISDNINISDNVVYKHLVALADSIGISEELIFKHFIYLTDNINISESIQAGHFISIYDSVSISDSITFKYSLFILDNISISDEIVSSMSDLCGSLFNIHSASYDIYLPVPERAGESGTLNNSIKLFDFWEDERDVVNIEISSNPIVLNGTIFACTDDEDVEMAAIAVKFVNIHDIINKHEEVTITELGDCIDAIYVIKKFTYKTIRRSPYAFTWSLTLEYVRAIE